MSLLIFFSIMQAMWPNLGRTVEFLRTGVVDLFKLLVLVAVMVAVIAGVIAIQVAARRIPIQIPRKVMGRGRIREGQKTFIPIRINSAGVMPIIFAQSIIIVPGTLATFSNIQLLRNVTEVFQPGAPLYYLSYAALIVFFTYFYTSIIFNPIDLAENLKKQGGFIPGVKPGAATADYIDEVLTRVTGPGAIFLCVLALLPFFVTNAFNVPFYFGGTAILIVVGVALDTVVQVQQHLHLRHYDDFMKKGRIKFRGRRRLI
jgi:preprotein translocase subunit SecY